VTEQQIVCTSPRSFWILSEADRLRMRRRRSRDLYKFTIGDSGSMDTSCKLRTVVNSCWSSEHLNQVYVLSIARVMHWRRYHTKSLWSNVTAADAITLSFSEHNHCSVVLAKQNLCTNACVSFTVSLSSTVDAKVPASTSKIFFLWGTSSSNKRFWS
jgi:hypothetical protein